jgi:hypothetical protein
LKHSIGFLCLIAGCFVFARRFTSQGERGWAVYSTVTGVVFLAGFAGIASGNQVGWLNLAFGAAVVTAWVWVSAVCARTGAQLRRPDGRFPTINPTVQEL